MAGELTTYRNSTIAAETTLFFLEVPTNLATPETKAYHMMYLRAENSSTDTGVETEDIPDVTQTTQATEIKSYKPLHQLSGVFLKSDPVCLYLEHLYRTRAVGGAAHANMVEVDTWADAGTSPYVAFKSDVSIAVTSIENEAGGLRRIQADITETSDPITGTATYTAESGVALFTPTAG